MLRKFSINLSKDELGVIERSERRKKKKKKIKNPHTTNGRVVSEGEAQRE